MTVLKTAENRDVLQCDGCGRSDAGPSTVLGIKSFAVHDPNVGSGVQHHYCAGCAANRGLSEPVAFVPGWFVTAVPAAPEADPDAT